MGKKNSPAAALGAPISMVIFLPIRRLPRLNPRLGQKFLPGTVRTPGHVGQPVLDAGRHLNLQLLDRAGDIYVGP